MSRIASGIELSVGDLVEVGDGAGEIALVGQHGRGAHAGEQRIGAVAILLQRIERGQRLVVLAVIGQQQRCEKSSPDLLALDSVQYCQPT